MVWLIVLGIVVVALIVVGIYDFMQTQHAIPRNFPIVGRLRFALERLGPELRQYIVTDNDEERPFSRDQRRWVYTSAKAENSYFGFGSDNDFETAPANTVIIRHVAFPQPDGPADDDPLHPVAAAKVLGAHHGRAHAFRPESIVNISAMSFGSLSAAAVQALNSGAKQARALHNTGEGGISDCHRHGGDLVLQLGTGYFGARTPDGDFSMARLLELVERDPVRAIEIKLSQGAKPGLGGVLPGAKVTKTIAEARGVPVGKTVHSPNAHREFSDVDGMIEFVERVADATGVPVGIKSAVGDDGFWHVLAQRMSATGGGPDFVTVDGGEGGTGAAPLAFSDHVALPFFIGFPTVYRAFAEHDLHEVTTFVGSGKLGFPDTALLALALGCDTVNVGREAMLSIGCIQAQKCHTGHCPVGVATQRPRFVRGLDPTSKSVRCANYLTTVRKELLRLARACGQPHPALVTLDRFSILDSRFATIGGCDQFGYEPGWGQPGPSDQAVLQSH